MPVLTSPTLTAAADRVAAAMARPEFYGANTGVVELHESHISRVYLVGDRAYKLKKPLKLPFLDSSSADRRHRLCREELRLNRRLAPELYLDVRAIVETGSGFRLAPENDPGALDYVVEMRRYDAHATLAERFASGRLRLRDLTRLGRTLAEFHAAAHRVTVADPSALELERRILENAQELIAVTQHPSDFDRVLKLERFIHAFVRANSQALAARARAGRVREGHGDLRAEHVVLGRRIEIVDCIEFNRDLRVSDVAEDLAFLVMDLTALGAERQSRQLVEAYRAAGGDPGDDQLIAFYACHRALIRAKVAALRAAQYAATSRGRGHNLAVARDLLAVAERFCWRARLPLVIVVCGVPAVGKTSLARALAQANGLEHLSSDVTRKRLAGIGPTDHAGIRHYTAQANACVYRELGRVASARAAARGGVIVDATFRHHEDRAAFDQAFRHAAPAVFIECRAPHAVVADRAAKRDARPHQVSDATFDVAMREGLVWDPLDEILPSAHLMVRTDMPVESQLNEVSGLLDLRLRALRCDWRR